MSTIDQINDLYSPPPLQLNIDQIAVILGVAKGSLYNRLMNGENAIKGGLPPLNKRLGRWVISRQSLADWMDGKTPEVSSVRLCKRGRPKKQSQFLTQLTCELQRLRQVEIDAYRNAEDSLKSDLKGLLRSGIKNDGKWL